MKEVDSIVIRFAGDSGDGMQLAGTQFADTSAAMGNDISTFPDFPAEIRAPAGTIAGVSGFQVHVGSTEIMTPGDEPDVLVAMNPAALKANIKDLKVNGTLIADRGSFEEKNLKKAGYEVNPLDDGSLDAYNVIAVDLTNSVMEALADSELDNKTKLRCKNVYALGVVYFMYDRDLSSTEDWLNAKFGKKPEIAEANIKALKGGNNFADMNQLMKVQYKIAPAKIEKGTYRQIAGNTATAWGFIQAAQKSGLNLYLGSYPITPATEILHELCRHKNFGVKTVQCEDEIAGICSSIGAAFGGALGITSTSGPGLALKGEALGLAMIYELPLVVVNVQRGGPSTGLPTKTEQSDLLQAMFGRNGESPCIVVAASRPSDCYEMAFEASRLALEHMTPVVLLTDGYIANGAEPWKIPDPKDFPEIKTRLVDSSKKEEDYQAYKRDENLVRTWAIPGMAGFEHRIGGLEKEQNTGNVCYDPENHQAMCDIRQKKVDLVANNIPKQVVEGDDKGDLLVLSWGGTYGATASAVKKLQKEGKKVSLAHLKYINPMPSNLDDIVKNFKKIIVPELNNGQLKTLINSKYSANAMGYNKLMGLPFKISELVEEFSKHC